MLPITSLTHSSGIAHAAAARTFKPDTAPRKGLGTGDVVALRMQASGHAGLAVEGATHGRKSVSRDEQLCSKSRHVVAAQSTCEVAARTLPPAVCSQGGGGLLAATEMGGDPSDASTVHFGFQPSATADASDKLTHLEVIRQVGAGLVYGHPNLRAAW